MKKQLGLLLLFAVAVSCSAQVLISGSSELAGSSLLPAPSIPVVYDASGFSASTGANSTWNLTVTVGAGHTNTALALLNALSDTGTASITSISGAGATWSKVGTSQTGNGNERGGECWIGIGPLSTGSQTITVTLNTAVSNTGATGVWSLYGVDPITPTSATCYSATSGSLAVPAAAGDIAVSIDVDSNNNNSVTGCTASTDQSSFAAIGVSMAHCATSPTSTFTWSAFATNSLVLGMDVK